MAQAGSSSAEILPQLEAARKLVLGDAHFYSQIVPGILPIVGPTAAVEVRRWGAEFLAETFATPALADPQKEEICLDVVAFVRTILDNPAEDVVVVKSAIQAAASFYTLLFRAMYVVLLYQSLGRVILLCASTRLAGWFFYGSVTSI
jgi:symplekin